APARLAVLAAVAGATLLGAVQPVAAVAVTMDKAQVDGVQGTPFVLLTTVTNDGNHTWPEAVVTLNVIRLGDGSSRDPEDWPPDWSSRSRGVGPGRSVEVKWQIRTIDSGDYLFFVTVVEVSGQASGEHVVSEPVRVHVEPRSPLAASRLHAIVFGVPLVPL